MYRHTVKHTYTYTEEFIKCIYAEKDNEMFAYKI